jgi:hypothetical protein
MFSLPLSQLCMRASSWAACCSVLSSQPGHSRTRRYRDGTFVPSPSRYGPINPSANDFDATAIVIVPPPGIAIHVRLS